MIIFDQGGLHSLSALSSLYMSQCESGVEGLGAGAHILEGTCVCPSYSSALFRIMQVLSESLIMIAVHYCVSTNHCRCKLLTCEAGAQGRIGVCSVLVSNAWCLWKSVHKIHHIYVRSSEM